MSGNQRNQSKFMFTEKPPKITCNSHPYDIDLLMHSEESLSNCCYMEDFELVVKSEIQKWLNDNDINVKFSMYFGIFYFKTDEERVKFILKWL